MSRKIQKLIIVQKATGTWVESDGINYDILNTEILDGRNEFMLLNATRRGSDILPINQQ